MQGEYNNEKEIKDGKIDRTYSVKHAFMSKLKSNVTEWRSENSKGSLKDSLNGRN